jgi:hypothetical protein
VKAVVDTNVVAYLLLGAEQYVDEAQTLMAALDEARAPALWEAEFANVLWMATRKKVLTIEEATTRLALAVRATESLCDHSLESTGHSATAVRSPRPRFSARLRWREGDFATAIALPFAVPPRCRPWPSSEWRPSARSPPSSVDWAFVWPIMMPARL